MRAQAQGGPHVVARAWTHDEPGCRLTGDLRWSEHPWQPHLVAKGAHDEIRAVLVVRRRPVAGAGSVAAVCGPLPKAVSLLEDPSGEPVMGKRHRGDPRSDLGLVVSEPAQLGD